jgi:hypothetical protein
VVRTFSMSAGLDASTVTPGSTAPDASLTTPLITACADATSGSNIANAKVAKTLRILSTAILRLSFLRIEPSIMSCEPLAAPL